MLTLLVVLLVALLLLQVPGLLNILVKTAIFLAVAGAVVALFVFAIHGAVLAMLPEGFL